MAMTLLSLDNYKLSLPVGSSQTGGSSELGYVEQRVDTMMVGVVGIVMNFIMLSLLRKNWQMIVVVGEGARQQVRVAQQLEFCFVV